MPRDLSYSTAASSPAGQKLAAQVYLCLKGFILCNAWWLSSSKNNIQIILVLWDLLYRLQVCIACSQVESCHLPSACGAANAMSQLKFREGWFVERVMACCAVMLHHHSVF